MFLKEIEIFVFILKFKQVDLQTWASLEKNLSGITIQTMLSRENKLTC